MSSNRWRSIFEITGLVAVVASLIFVGVQLRQDQVIARSDLGAGSFDYMASIHETMSDPTFASVYAKMLTKPRDLSVDEQISLNGLLMMVSELFSRECYLKYTDIFDECDAVINELVPLYFGNSYAQSWWRQNWNRWDDSFANEDGWPTRVDAKIADTSPNLEVQRLRRTLEGLK